MDLLVGTPKGVYQLEKYLTGPLGLIHSYESRYLPPSVKLPLWHCSDTGCGLLHYVKFLPPQGQLAELDHLVKKMLREELAPPSEWDYAFFKKYLARRQWEEKPHKYSDLAILIADSIIGRERTSLLTRAVEGKYGKDLRGILSTPPRRRNAGDGRAEEVAARLSAEEQLQILLCLPDTAIIDLLDQLTNPGELSIPHGQTRTANERIWSSTYSVPCQFSRLGVRSTQESPIVTVTWLIYSAYMEQELRGELRWKLRASESIPMKDALVTYVREKGPKLAVKELVLSSPKIAEYICDKLRLSLNRLVSETDDAVDRILWKMGFDPPQYDDFSKRLMNHIDRFDQAVLSTTSLETEDEREFIRSAGVNLFVYLERFIDKLVSYNVWLLSSDHFLDTKFRFDLDHARAQVKHVLGATLTSGDTCFSWNAQGENSLGVLLAYINESVGWINSLLSADRDKLKRPENDLPHFVEVYSVPFPFYHTEQWADCDPAQLRSYCDGYSVIVSLLQKAELGSVRNGLDHMRDNSRFPSTEKMLACVSRIREACTTAIVRRYLPEIWWFERLEADLFSMNAVHLTDNFGHSLVLHGPQMMQCLPHVPTRAPVLVAPGNLLGEPNAPLLFSVLDVTEYDLYWRGYPRRLRIPSNAD